MNSLLIVLVGIVVIANFIFTIWSYLSLKKLTSSADSKKPADNFLIEQVVHTRSSLNVLYASIAIMTFVLAFFGFNVPKNVTEQVTKDVAQAAKVDLEALKIKSDHIGILDSLGSAALADLTKFRDLAQGYSESIKRLPQKLFVVHDLQVTKSTYFLYSDLKPVDGSTLPKFLEPPVVLWNAHSGDMSIGTDVKPDIKGINISPVDACSIDLWIYAR